MKKFIGEIRILIGDFLGRIIYEMKMRKHIYSLEALKWKFIYDRMGKIKLLVLSNQL